MATSWAPEVFVEGKWSRNAVRLATEAEARAAAHNTFMRWTLCDDYRATESADPINFRWDAALGLVSTLQPTEG